MEINEEKLNQLLGQVVLEMGAAANGPLIKIGDQLGLYETLGKSDSLSAAELAASTQTAERYVREWLAAQVASGYVEYNAQDDRFYLSPEQFAVFGDRKSPALMTGAFYIISSLYHDEKKLQEAFKTGQGVSWGEHDNCLFCGTEKFFSPSYESNLVDSWLPAFNGVVEKLTNGAKVADVGCGHASSTMILAKAFPKSHFIGIDFHHESIDEARAKAKKAGLSNIEFKVATAKNYSDKDFDFIAFFDCLHDMGDPVGACKHAKQALKADGSCMVVEPFANDSLIDNLNPVSRAFYAFSTQLCVPCSLNQEVGLSLGAQAGLKKLTETIETGGFKSCTKVAETPFNLILELKP